jgi:hypothetical protein
MRKRGGKREGAGRKPIDGVARVHLSCRVPPAVLAYLRGLSKGLGEAVIDCVERHKAGASSAV